MGIPSQRQRPATWKVYTKQQMESSRQMEEPATMTCRCLELFEKGVQPQAMLVSMCLTSSITFSWECLAGASFSLAEIENGKPGISLAMLSDLVVFFHQALRGNREIAGSKSSHLVMIQAPWDRVSTSCLRVHCVTMILRIFTNTHGDKGIHPGDNYQIFNRQCASLQCLNMPC